MEIMQWLSGWIRSKLPPEGQLRISRAQSEVLKVLSSENLKAEQSGRDLKSHLAQQGHNKSGPAFYQMMARLEDRGLVQSESFEEWLEGYKVKRKKYVITPDGVSALDLYFGIEIE